MISTWGRGRVLGRSGGVEMGEGVLENVFVIQKGIRDRMGEKRRVPLYECV